jgi:serine/threonine-protein kinase
MAIVYLAHEIALDRKVALKVMLPELLAGAGLAERFKREARTAANLSHPHIIPIYWVKQTEEMLFFVMKYVNGRALDSIIKEVGPLPIPMVQAILSQVAGALAYAHRKGVIHRDIKPGNIMLDDEGWAMVTDFGIAKIADATGLTNTGSTVGTPFYMSPEQCESKAITGSADQYSLGIVAYEMLTGKPPFTGETILDLMRAHFFEVPRPVQELRPDCPPRLARMMMRMLEKKPEGRWPTLDAVVAEVDAPLLSVDDPVRSQMITLAVSGARKGLVALPITPRSPVPASTDRVRPNRPHKPRTRPAPRSGIRWGTILVGVLLFVVGAGSAGWLAGSGWFLGALSGRAATPAREDPAVAEVPHPLPASTPTPAPIDSPPAPAGATPPAAVTESTNTAVPRPAARKPEAQPRQQRPAPEPARVPPPTRPSSSEARRDSTVTSPVVRGPSAVAPSATPTASPAESTAVPQVPGSVLIGPTGDLDSVALSINGALWGSLKRPQWVPVPAGNVRLQLVLGGCTSWDSTLTVGAGERKRIGLRKPRCS